MTGLALPPAPHLVVPLLLTAVSNVCFAATIYTNHSLLLLSFFLFPCFIRNPFPVINVRRIRVNS